MITTLFVTTIKSHTFLQFDSRPNEYRTLILPSHTQIEILAVTKRILFDRTLSQYMYYFKSNFWRNTMTLLDPNLCITDNIYSFVDNTGFVSELCISTGICFTIGLTTADLSNSELTNDVVFTYH
jgi:hypothetical protein